MKETRIGWPEDKYPDSALSLYAQFGDLNRGRVFIDDYTGMWVMLAEHIERKSIDHEHRLNDEELSHRAWHFAVSLNNDCAGEVRHLSTIKATKIRLTRVDF